MDNENKSFVKDLQHDEIRSGFLVKSDKKKLWNAQIIILNEFARICKKYKLKWAALAGTLLGAARHRGFIPWDDDVDVSMLRPDYEKFKQIAMKELKSPYVLDVGYSYNVPNDYPKAMWPVHQFIKIRNNDTVFIEPAIKNVRGLNHGIYIDIFPLDPMPPFNDKSASINFEIEKILAMTIYRPEIVESILTNNQKTIIGNDKLKELMRQSVRHRMITLEKFLAEHYFESEYVEYLQFVLFLRNKERSGIHHRKLYDDIIYLPFEEIEMPCPRNYDEVLKSYYGDWKQLVIGPQHTNNYSVDISYRDYFKLIDKVS